MTGSSHPHPPGPLRPGPRRAGADHERRHPRPGLGRPSAWPAKPGSSPSSSAATPSPSTSAAARRIASPGQRLALGALWSTCSFADCPTPLRLGRDPPRQPVQRRRRPRPDQHRRAHPRLWALPRPRPSPDWHFDKLPDGSTLTRAPDGTQWRRPARPATTSRAASGGGHPPRHPDRAGRHPLHPRRLTEAGRRAPARTRWTSVDTPVWRRLGAVSRDLAPQSGGGRHPWSRDSW